MKNGLLLFFGLAVLAALSWATLLLTPHRQYGGLTQFKDPVDESLHPYGTTGLASRGRQVYRDLGCAYCHTQQVRHVGADVERKWGGRESYARDYIKDQAVFLGTSRLGPDLRNVGLRLGDAAPEPAHPFLYEVRPLAGRQRSPKALDLPARHAPPAGSEVVPTRRAEELVAYLQSLKDTYEYPEEKRRNAPPPGGKKGAGH
jgi:cytochrome c oxidase cbb3-type subunit 2